MSGLVHSRTGSGLIVSEYGADGAAVLRALKDHDPDLRLIPPGVSVQGAHREHWAVYLYRGSERPPVFVLAWTGPDGGPLPLSHRLVDAVKQRDLNGRGNPLSADQLNAARAEARRRQEERDREALRHDHLSSAGKHHVPHRSVALRMTRDKQRSRGRKV